MAITRVPGSMVGANTITGNNILDGTISTSDFAAGLSFGPAITSITYPDDDTAADTAGGQTIIVTGRNFLTGAYVIVDGAQVGSVSLANSTSLSFTAPAKATGSYVLFVVNTDGSAAILVPGIQYSGTPTYTTAAGSLLNVYELNAVSTSVSATGDTPLTYSIASGALPAGVTLSPSGTLSGTAPADTGSTTYSFVVQVKDAQNQTTNRTFSITVNTDTITWVNPANNITWTTGQLLANTFALDAGANSAAGRAITYSANTLPAGLTLSGNTISGTPNTVANTTTLITATSATTGRTATRTINWVVELGSDTYWRQTTLLLDGVPAIPPYYNDASNTSTGTALLPAGNNAVTKFSPYTPGYYSAYFDGSDRMSIAHNAALDLGSGDFTVEFWMKTVTWSGTSGILGKKLSDSTNGWQIYRDNTLGKMNARLGGTNNFTTVTDPKPNVWEHWALVRTGSTLYWFKNGVLDNTGSSSLNVSDATASFNAGFADTWSVYGTLYLSNVRIVKGTALYTSNFTPSVTPLTAITNTTLLLFNHCYFKDNSTNNFTLTRTGDTAISPSHPFPINDAHDTYGSVYFDGTDDVIAGSTPSLVGNFTIECWIYPTTNSTQVTFLSFNSGGVTGINIWRNTSNQLVVDDGSNAQTAFSGNTISYNTWNHIAVVRSGTTTTGYINGVSVGTNSFTPAATANVQIGNYNGTTKYWFTGHISNVRVVPGVTVYTGNFTPDTSAQLAVVANTSLLTLQYAGTMNGIAMDATKRARMIRNSNTTITTMSPYGKSFCYYFDGDDYVQTPASSLLALTGNSTVIPLTSNLAIDAWIFQTQRHTNATLPVLIGDMNNAGTTNYFSFGPSSTGYLQVYWYDGSGKLATGNTLIPLNTWTHIAFQKQGTAIRLYVNGTLQTLTGTTTWTATSGTVGYFNIGSYGGGAATGFYGQVSDIRVTNGIVYSNTSFEVSRAPLAPLANTTATTTLMIGNTPNHRDLSPLNHTLTIGGNTSITSPGPYTNYTQTPNSYSVNFSATGTYISGTNTAFNISATATLFTFECWLFPITAGYFFAIGSGSPYGNSLTVDWGLGTADKFRVMQGNGSSNFLSFSTTGTYPAGRWYHVAVSKDSSGVRRLFIDGVADGTQTDTTTTAATGTQWVINGSYDNNGLGNSGGRMTVSNARFVVGQALYTANFTPSTSALTVTGNTKLLACASTQLIDVSNTVPTLTVAGRPRVMPSSPFGYTTNGPFNYSANTMGASIYFDGASDYYQTPNTTDYAVTTQDFTAEAWIYQFAQVGGATQKQGLFRNFWANNSSCWYWSAGNAGYTGSTNFSANQQNDGGNQEAYGATFGASNGGMYRWIHCALTRSGGLYKMYYDGVLVANTNTTYGSTVDLNAGALSTYLRIGDGFFGFQSDHRLTIGKVVYTTDFLPPVAPLRNETNPEVVRAVTFLSDPVAPVIHDKTKSPSQIETFANTKLVQNTSPYYEGTSCYFDGTGDYISITANNNLVFGTSNFTIEVWVKLPSLAASQPFVTSHQTGGMMQLSVTTAGRLSMAWNVTGGTGYVTTVGTTTTITANTWTHLAVVRNGATMTMYVNGVADATTYAIGAATSIQSYNGAKVWYVMGGSDLANYSTGWVSNLRVVKQAVYTSNFTPSTVPLTVVANTEMLLCHTYRIVDGSGLRTITRNGDVSVRANEQPFANANVVARRSIQFAGSDQVVIGASNTNMTAMNRQTAFGTGDFTIEFWFYAQSTARQDLYDQNTGTRLLIYWDGTNLIYYAGATAAISGGTLPQQQWSHIAVARSSGSTKMFINGVQVGSTYTDTNSYSASTISLGKDSAGTTYVTGFMADVRITKGYARYTTAFTPPTKPSLAL